MSLQLKFYDIWDEARDDGFEEGKKEGIKEGMKAGKAAGKLHQLFELVSDNVISVEDAYVRTEMTKEEFIVEMDQYLSNKE